MNGAREYAKYFTKAEQHGRLYILPSSHARGKTFRIFVLPKGENVIAGCGINPPLNDNTVLVYGMISGQRGWTESYGWIHKGSWVQDFERILQEKKDAITISNIEATAFSAEAQRIKDRKIKSILKDY